MTPSDRLRAAVKKARLAKDAECRSIRDFGYSETVTAANHAILSVGSASDAHERALAEIEAIAREIEDG